MIAQFAYAALTSRIVDPAGFGIYGVALTVAAFISLLANGGLGQAIGRMKQLEPDALRALSTYGLILGGVGSALLFFTAPLWASFWAVPEATEPIRWLSISAFLAPCLGLATGLMRRLGNFRKLAFVTLIGNLSGMSAGALAVSFWGNPSSLLVSPIAAQIVLVIASYALTEGMLLGIGRVRFAREAISFSRKLTVATFFSYFAGNVGPWTVTTLFGAGQLGQWNRASVVTAVPFHQIQTAMIQAVYPEFRHDISSPKRAHDTWPDLMALVGWAVMPISAAAAIILPSLVPILFGPGWGDAAALSTPLALIGGLQAVVMMLWGAVEALGKFRWIWTAQILSVSVSALSAASAMVLHDWTPIFVGMFVSLMASHLAHVWYCVRAGYLSGPKLLKNYSEVAAGSLLVALLAKIGLVSVLSIASLPWVTVSYLLFLALLCYLAWRFRNSLPPVALGRKYNLLR